MSDSIWYVCYQPLGPYRGTKEPSRLSKTFANEWDAKKFAMTRLAVARNITAGTINPHLPKRVIGSAQISEWLNEENDASTARGSPLGSLKCPGRYRTKTRQRASLSHGGARAKAPRDLA